MDQTFDHEAKEESITKGPASCGVRSGSVIVLT